MQHAHMHFALGTMFEQSGIMYVSGVTAQLRGHKVRVLHMAACHNLPETVPQHNQKSAGRGLTAEMCRRQLQMNSFHHQP
jgi:hypothetical protein